MKFASTKRIVALLALLTAQACFSEADVPVKGTQWRVESLGTDTTKFAQGEATIAFGDDGRLSAYAGCNRMAGSYNVRGHVLEISQLVATRMACMPAQKMRDEQALSDALSKVTQVDIVDDKATLQGADGVVIVLWRDGQ
ncbi:MAG: hypothetical protein C0436_03060 [Alphaproteobacteria bacterium]|nr:hypothetical protein [Alphaproteobacteria bacterium]